MMDGDSANAKRVAELVATPPSLLADRALRVANIEIEKQRARIAQLGVAGSSRDRSSTS